MRTLKVAFPAVIVTAGLMFCTVSSYGKPEYAKKEKQSCTTCHAKVEGKDAMPKNLTEVGKCYAANDHSLAKCKVPEKK